MPRDTCECFHLTFIQDPGIEGGIYSRCMLPYVMDMGKLYFDDYVNFLYVNSGPIRNTVIYHLEITDPKKKLLAYS